MLTRPFFPSFLIHIVCQSRLYDVMFYAWSLVSNFLVRLLKFLSGTEYLTKVTAQVFIPLIRFLLDSFVSSSFLVLLKYSFWIFHFISTCFMVSASKITPSLLILSWFGSSVPSIRFGLLLLITNMAHFSMPNSILMSWLYIPTVYIRVSCSFSFFLQIVCCHPCTFGDFVIFWPFDPTKNAIPRWCTRRRWHILMAVVRGNRVGGNWLMKWDELKSSHGTLKDWCTGREWPVNCMTVISAWWRLNIRFQRLSGRSCRRWTII